MCELYETSLAMVIFWATDDSDSGETNRDMIQKALRELAVHLHHHRGLNINDLPPLTWTDVRFRLYNAADRALINGAGPNELAAATRAVSEYLSQHGLDGLQRLTPDHEAAQSSDIL
jgi:hypothetical protein